MRSLEGKVVLLTGASRGLGVDMARAFARKGAILALAARSAPDLEVVRKEIEASGGRAFAFPADVTDLDALRGLVSDVAEQAGPIEVLINNAGVERVYDFEATSPEELENIVRVNLLGPLLLTRLVVPEMIARGDGAIVNVASVAGLAPVPHNATYSATKHAIVGLSRSLRLELADHGIGVSFVAPGAVAGGMFLEWGRPMPGPAGGVVTSEQVARAVLDAVLHDRGEIVVTKGLAKLGDVAWAMIPSVAANAMRRTGVVGFLRDQAKINRDEAGS